MYFYCRQLTAGVTQNINFITNISTSPGTLKKRLLRLPGSPFVQRAQVLFYTVPDTGREIRVDILPEWLVRFSLVLPSSPHFFPYAPLDIYLVIDTRSTSLGALSP